MSKPPRTPPHSDIDGVDEDAEFNVDAANQAGQDTADLDRAARETPARPDYSSDKNRDDRSR